MDPVEMFGNPMWSTDIRAYNSLNVEEIEANDKDGGTTLLFRRSMAESLATTLIVQSLNENRKIPKETINTLLDGKYVEPLPDPPEGGPKKKGGTLEDFFKKIAHVPDEQLFTGNLDDLYPNPTEKAIALRISRRWYEENVANYKDVASGMLPHKVQVILYGCGSISAIYHGLV